MSKYVVCTSDQWTNNITQGNYDGWIGSGGTYSDIPTWESARDGLDAADENTVLHIYGDVESAQIDINGFTDKDSSHYLEICNSTDGDHHDGTVDGSGDTLSINSSSNNLIVRINNAKVHDLRILSIGAGASPVIWFLSQAAGTTYAYNNILRVSNSVTASYILSIQPTGSQTIWIYNNFLIAVNVGSYYAIYANDAECDNTYILNNSILLSTVGRGINTAATNTNKIRNNLNFATGYWYVGDDTNASYEGVPCADGASYDPDGTGCVYNLTASKIFNDLTSDQEDLTLNPAGDDFSSISTAGIGPSSDSDVPSTDILGNTRSGTTCCIGAFEYVASGGTTASPTTTVPTTVSPTTVVPTTIAPTTLAPTTLPPTTLAPTTIEPTTVAPTTLPPTTIVPTTLPPTTLSPTTIAPTTLAPTTTIPTTIAPTTVTPTTLAPTTLPPTTVAPTTILPTTIAPTTVSPTTLVPTTPAPPTKPPMTLVPTTLVPTTAVPTLAPTTVGPTTTPPTLAPTTAPPPPIVSRRGISNFGFSCRAQWR